MRFPVIVFAAAFLLVACHVTAEISLSELFVTPDPDHKSFEQLVTSHGFNLQAYSVQTEDGYILTVHRVVPQNYSAADYTKTRKPVIVNHGVLGSAHDFFINSPFLTREDNTTACGDNFGFCLVLTGRYDIWLINNRGNGYSEDHISGMTSKDFKFWAFTFDHLGRFDAPAVIDFVLKATGHEKVGFVGYSQGSMLMFALLSLKPEYANKIQPFIAWAPSVFMGTTTSTVRFLVPFTAPLKIGGKFVLSDELFKKLLEVSCGGLGGYICDGFLDAIVGKSDSLNRTRFPVYFHYLPATVSNWQMAHITQLMKTDEFARYDYGLLTNLKEYGQVKPPLYPLENIPENFTVMLVHGNTDAFVTKKGAERLVDTLTKAKVNVVDYLVPRDVWGHLDYFLGMGAGALVYDKTIQFLDQYTA